MSHGGPEVAYREADGSLSAYCSEDSDFCEYGEHKKCTGSVEHRRGMKIIDRATGDEVGVLGDGHALTAGHMCHCRCHWNF